MNFYQTMTMTMTINDPYVYMSRYISTLSWEISDPNDLATRLIALQGIWGPMKKKKTKQLPLIKQFILKKM